MLIMLISQGIRQSLRRGRRLPYDPVSPVVIVPPPTCYPDRAAAPCSSQATGTLAERWDSIFAEALAEVNDKLIYDPQLPTDLYTDGSCTDNGRPFAAAGWGVHVHNSDQLGEYFGALPDQVQTNNRAELTAVEAALQLAWNSTHTHCRVFADSNYAKLGISNDTDAWAWRSALGLHGWLDRWYREGWRTATGNRVRHSDIWKRIRKWLRLFEGSETRRVEVLHVKAHAGVEGNERADCLAAQGSKLRLKLMDTDGWFQYDVKSYWGIRCTS